MKEQSSPLQRLKAIAGRQFVRRSASVGIIRVLGLVFIFVMQVLLARLVGDSEEYGKYAWAQSLTFMLGGMAGLGIPTVTGRFVAALRATGLEQNIPAVIRRGRNTLLYSSAALVLAAAGLRLLGNDLGGDYAEVAPLAILMAPLVSFGLFFQYLSQGRQWMVSAFAPMYLVRPVLVAILAVATWYIGGASLDSVTVLSLLGCSLLLTYGGHGFYFHRRQRSIIIAATDPPQDSEYSPNRLRKIALPIFVARLANIFMEYTNVLLVGFIAGPAAAGAYFAAERLAILAAMPWKVMSPVSQPEYAGAHARGDERELRRLVRRTAHAIFWPSALVAIALTLLAAPLLSIFGEGFGQAAPVLGLLALTAVVRAAFGPAGELLLMTGHQTHLPAIYWITAILHLIGLAVLTPTLGVAGAALTSVLTTAFSHTLLALLVRRQLHINPTILSWRRA